MKKMIGLLLLGMITATLSGCATSGGRYETRLAPPEAGFNGVFLRYQELAGEKVLVVAVDPGDNWAFGFDHNRDTLAEAAEKAAMKCDLARKDHKVFTKAKIFAINDEIVYYKNQLK